MIRYLLILLFGVGCFNLKAQVVNKNLLTPPLGLVFGMNQPTVDAKLKEQGGVVNERKSISGAKVYENIELGDYYVDIVAYFRLSKLTEFHAKVKESKSGRRIYQQIRENIVLKYNIPTIESQFDEELYSAHVSWVFKNGIIWLDLSEKEVMIKYIDADVADTQNKKAKNSF